MPNVRLIFPNAADEAALTCSPAEVAALPVANLQEQSRGHVWRSTGIAAQRILGDFSGYQSISAVALVRHNLTASATYRLRLYDQTGQTGTLLYDSGAVIVAGDMLEWGAFEWGVDPWGAGSLQDWPVPYFVAWFPAVNALSFDLELDDTANPDGFLQAARLVMGAYFEPTYNLSAGMEVSWRETSKQSRTEGGTLRTDERDPYRRFSFSLEHLSPAERTTLLDRLRRVGLRNDLFLSCYPESGGDAERDYAGLVKLVEIPTLSLSRPGAYRTQLIFEEA